MTPYDFHARLWLAGLLIWAKTAKPGARRLIADRRTNADDLDAAGWNGPATTIRTLCDTLEAALRENERLEEEAGAKDYEVSTLEDYVQELEA